MNCRHVRALLSAYLDSELTGYEMLAIREHLANCEGCSEERASIELVRAMVRSLPQREPRPEWLSSLQREAYFASLPLAARLRIFLSQDASVLSFRGRRLASAAMLSVIGVFIAAGAFDAPPAQHATATTGAEFAPAPPRASLTSFNPVLSEPPLMANQDIQLLDPRQHPADLPAREGELTLFNVLEPQSRYNKITFTSFTSLGNQLVTPR